MVQELNVEKHHLTETELLYQAYVEKTGQPP
jgi:hypothetical protein